MSPTFTRIYLLREVLRQASELRKLQETFTFLENLLRRLELSRQQFETFAFIDNLDYTINSVSPDPNPTAFPEAEGWGAGATVGTLT